MFEDKQGGLTPITNLGEFSLIEKLTKDFPSFHTETLKGVGDDAAVIKLGEGKVQLISTDLLLEGIHFDLRYVPLRHLGYKAVAVNVSDICAMNGKPYGITVSIGISNRFTVEALEALYEGIRLACEKYRVELLGGDTSSSRQGLVISVSAYGEGAENTTTYRNGAKKHDLICVSGDLGAAYAGLLVLEREKAVFLKDPNMQPDLTTYGYAIGRQLKPEARTDVIGLLENLGVLPTSMMDISDGLASELHHICHQSKCGAFIYARNIPIDYLTSRIAGELEISPYTFALNGGEDYELVFTISLKDYEKLKGIEGLHIIGHITDEPGRVQMELKGGSVVDVEAQGWTHF